MGAPSRPRFGSLQVYPRKRVDYFIPSVNWSTIKTDSKHNGLLGYILYKVGMGTALVKDSTDKSMTQGKKVYIPVTILEAPSMKVFAVRFYKNNLPIKDIIVSHDKDLKKIIKLPKQLHNFDEQVPKEFEDIRILVYSIAKQTSVKKTPDIGEIGVSAQNKLEYVKTLFNKELSMKDSLITHLVDVRGVTTGRGLSGPVKRFGITLKGHKSEKGVRRPGSLAPWHPARVTFRTPMAGQLGMFSRIHYNSLLITQGSISEKNINPSSGFKNYGNINSSYVVLKGSVQGPPKRQILITPAFRTTKILAKTKYELLELLT